MTTPPAEPAPFRLKEMHPGEVAAHVAADPRLILPVGTCEQHGPHLPFGCDTYIVERLADDLSATYKVLRAPTIEFGVNVDTERALVGSGSVSRKGLRHSINDLLACWEAGGIREFIILTAHGHDPHQEALATVITVTARVRVVDIFGMDLTPFLEGQTEAMHGDEVDTSIMLYLYPHLVQMDRAQDYMMSREELRRYRRGWLRVPKGSPGSIGRPTLATAEKGERLYRHIRERVGERIFRSASPEE